MLAILPDIRNYLQKAIFAFRAVKSRNFRLYFAGQVISLQGSWIQNIAMGWLVYRLTDSPLWLGVIAFSGQAPSLLFTPFAGVYADRWNRRRTMIFTNLMFLTLSGLLAFLVIASLIEVWHLVVLSLATGIVMALDTPFRHAFLVEMVDDRRVLPNAVALNSTLYNSARFIGPTIGGILIIWLGEGWCFFINAVSFLAAIGALMMMRVKPMHHPDLKQSVLEGLLQGLSYAWRHREIRYLLLMVGSTGFFGLPFQAFLPVFARDILHGDPALLGFLTGVLGAGALTAALSLASMASIRRLPRLIMVSGFLFALSMAVFALSRFELLSLFMLYLMGFGMIAQFVSVNTLLQSVVTDEMRGRVMALYGLTFMGVTPLGSLLFGFLGRLWSVQGVLFCTAMACLVVAMWFWRKVNTIRHHVEAGRL
jgi:MFS family permease